MVNIVNINLEIDKLISQAKGSYSSFKENKTYNKEAYDKLLVKYGDAISIIEQLKAEIDKLKDEELTKEKIETMSSALELMSNLDSDKIDNLIALGKRFGDKK